MSSGKFYKAPDKNVEVLLRDIDEQEIRTGGTFSLSACGRSWELSGTTGSVGLEDVDDNHIATFHWDVPLGSKTNTFEVQDIAADYRVTFNGYNRRGGHLGTVKVEVTRL